MFPNVINVCGMQNLMPSSKASKLSDGMGYT